MKIADLRKFALSLPEVRQEPHFQYTSFRIEGKIFATVSEDEQYAHIFVEESLRAIKIATNPEAYEKLWWGKKVTGLRVRISVAKARDVEELLLAAWKRKAPKRLRKA